MKYYLNGVEVETGKLYKFLSNYLKNADDAKRVLLTRIEFRRELFVQPLVSARLQSEYNFWFLGENGVENMVVCPGRVENDAFHGALGVWIKPVDEP